MIVPFDDPCSARSYINSVPYDEVIEEWIPLCTDGIEVLKWVDDGEIKGAFVAVRINKHVVSVHAAIPEKSRGRDAVRAGKEGISWVFDKMEPKTIISRPSYRSGEIYSVLVGLNRIRDGVYCVERTKWEN